jgi:peptidoglycan hydrolase-like amidase
LASRTILLLLAILPCGRAATAQTAPRQTAPAQTVDIGVFGLFHPRQIELRSIPGTAVAVEADGQTFVLESSSGRDAARIEVLENRLEVEIGGRVIKARSMRATSRRGVAVDFVLSVPGKISRHYNGTLHVTAEAGALVPVVGMDLEIAVASAVQAESPPGAPLEALKAQAVATRSYFVAGLGRHEQFDFCDTTHCQFLREPPPENSAASLAASQTRGLILAYNERPFAPMFTRSCGGRTRTPREIGLPAGSYPYFSVPCKYCQEHPMRWQSRVSQENAATLRQTGEAGRLEIDRKQGWSAVPSNNFTAVKDGPSVLLEGTGQGHGVGLCQLGAKAMAEAGASFRGILEHYYPNTSLRELKSAGRANKPPAPTR